jgi:hypothetical protein
MHALDRAILEVFKKTEGKELITSEIVALIFPGEANTFNVDSAGILFVGGEKRVKSSIRYKKSLLHKRLLYHLNKLVKQGILKLSGIEEFGEKRFALSEDHGDLIIEDKKKTIIIRNGSNPSTPIDGYEDQRIIKKLDSPHWINKLDALIINANRFSEINKIYDIVIDLFNEVTDCIAIINFEKMINNSDLSSIESFTRNISDDTKDYNKMVSLIIDCEQITDNKKMKGFLKYFATVYNPNLQLVFDITTQCLSSNKDMIIYLIKVFSDNKVKINIKNKSLFSMPVFFGKAGVYSFDEKEWKVYEKEYADKTIGASCCSSTLIIDVQEFFNNYKTAHEFRTFILKANKSLLIANVNKRKIAHQYLRTIHKLNKPNSREFFMFERNYIRFWNYNFRLFGKKTFLLDLFKSSKEGTESFSFTEETIYKACGIPVRFKVAFSSAFRVLDLTMTERTYVKRTVHDMSYFELPEALEYLKTREKLSKIFSGVDRIRFFRVAIEDPNDVLNEFNYIMQNFYIPFFTYDFAKIKGNTKLTSFFKVQKNKKKVKN